MDLDSVFAAPKKAVQDEVYAPAVVIEPLPDGDAGRIVSLGESEATSPRATRDTGAAGSGTRSRRTGFAAALDEAYER